MRAQCQERQRIMGIGTICNIIGTYVGIAHHSCHLHDIRIDKISTARSKMYYPLGNPPPSIPAATLANDGNKMLPLAADLLPL